MMSTDRGPGCFPKPRTGSRRSVQAKQLRDKGLSLQFCAPLLYSRPLLKRRPTPPCPTSCRSGEIGRHVGFKIRCLRGRAGSSPASGTTPITHTCSNGQSRVPADASDRQVLPPVPPPSRIHAPTVNPACRPMRRTVKSCLRYHLKIRSTFSENSVSLRSAPTHQERGHDHLCVRHYLCNTSINPTPLTR